MHGVHAYDGTCARDAARLTGEALEVLRSAQHISAAARTQAPNCGPAGPAGILHKARIARSRVPHRAADSMLRQTLPAAARSCGNTKTA